MVLFDFSHASNKNKYIAGKRKDEEKSVAPPKKIPKITTAS